MSASAPPVTGTVGVTIAVPTYRRPDELRALLPVLLDQAREVDGRYAARLLVVDNDPEGSAAATVRALAAPGVRYVTELTPGIAAARNRALDEAAGSRLLAFIDDDERPADGWLQHLLEAWAATGAAAVSGLVLAQYAGELDPWIQDGDFFLRRSMPTGTRIDVAATNNLLLDLEQVSRLGVRFDTALGLGGGEDTLFSRQIARAGGRMVWCQESAVVDQVPATRMTRTWVLRRSLNQGNVTVLIDLRLASGPGGRAVRRVRGFVGGLVRLGGGALRWCWGRLTGSRRHRARGLRFVFRGAGMVSASFGWVYQAYGRSGRRWRRAPGARR